MFEAGYAFTVVFLVCELCQRATDAFNKINDTIGGFDWYLFPIEIQKMLPTIMIVTQKIVGQKYFGSIMCLRPTFKKVRNTSNSSSI